MDGIVIEPGRIARNDDVMRLVRNVVFRLQNYQRGKCQREKIVKQMVKNLFLKKINYWASKLR